MIGTGSGLPAGTAWVGVRFTRNAPLSPTVSHSRNSPLQTETNWSTRRSSKLSP